MRYRSSSTGISVRVTPELVFDFILEKAFAPIGIHIPSAPDVAPLRNREFKQVNEFDYEKLRPLVALSSLGKLPQINIPIERVDAPPLGISLLSGYNQDCFLIHTVKKVIAYTNELNQKKF
jgi:hypothetical protein